MIKQKVKFTGSPLYTLNYAVTGHPYYALCSPIKKNNSVEVMSAWNSCRDSFLYNYMSMLEGSNSKKKTYEGYDRIYMLALYRAQSGSDSSYKGIIERVDRSVHILNLIEAKYRMYRTKATILESTHARHQGPGHIRLCDFDRGREGHGRAASRARRLGTQGDRAHREP